MIQITQHIPSFVERGDTPLKQASIQSAADLDTVEWINSWRKRPDFFRFSVARHRINNCNLMAELNGGMKWWVIAYLSEDIPDLPTWEPTH